ncbi:MAG: tetratricopeptide repeat protein [Bacteriovoracales bacterium]|nr:tetratricopeptide repeat protein [Bacteriovoracales bacterium]
MNKINFQDTLYQLQYGSLFCLIKGHSLVRIFGKDAEKFLQGQLSNDVSKLTSGKAQMNCRLTIKGKIQNFFSLARFDSDFYIFIKDHWAQELSKELNRYIIAEDVQLEIFRSGEFVTQIGADIMPSREHIPIHLLGHQGHIVDENEKNIKAPIYPLESLKKEAVYSGFPIWGKSVQKTDFINETPLNLYGISYEKGCFFGQETPSKINSGRGALHFPCLVKVDAHLSQCLKETSIEGSDIFVSGQKIGNVIDYLIEEDIIYCKLKRPYRILGQKLSFDISGMSFQGVLVKFPTIGWMNDRELSQHLFLEASQLYHKKNDPKTATRLLERAIQLNPKNPDAHEALGVILGHQKKYDEAIDMMKKLAKIDPDSIMSHTNLSLFYMKIGDIEKAEEYKAQAALLGMKLAAKKAKEKKNRELTRKEKKEELTKRMKMYHQVLNIDPADSLAHYNLANIYFENDDLQRSIEHSRQALESNHRYSMAYLLLGKALEKSGEKKEAKDIYHKGLEIAALQGETVPANKMQAKLSGMETDNT